MVNEQIIWLLTNCNNKAEAHSIGQKLLSQRLIACYDVIPEREATYFWPPKTDKIETVTGSLLIGVTIANKFEENSIEIKKHHSDEVPFIVSISIENVNTDYKKWLLGELQ